ncbi:MAG TPA: hypothetical protein VK698_34500 [Kofleriaceae bacterium]|nr:hypothetical protein [Kofleriaceae bacterium]
MSRARASAPGKILLAGEYAVLEGGPAVVMAVGRRAQAWIAGGADADRPPAPPRSPFLLAVAAVLAGELGPDSAAARAALRVRVDTSALAAASGEKLGLGSSAAATVAALAACLAAERRGPLDRALLHRLAHRAHAEAQAGLAARIVATDRATARATAARATAAGANPGDGSSRPAGAPIPAPPLATRGSGADIAASVWGGLLHLEPSPLADQPPRVQPLALPAGLELVAVWTGRPADTRVLVAGIAAFASRAPAAYRGRLAALAGAAAALTDSCRAGDPARAVAAIAAGGDAVRELGAAAGVELFLDSHRALGERAAALGGALKPTGAGGGDIALGAFDRADRAEQFRAHGASLGMIALDLSVDPRGAAREDDSA